MYSWSSPVSEARMSDKCLKNEKVLEWVPSLAPHYWRKWILQHTVLCFGTAHVWGKNELPKQPRLAVSSEVLHCYGECFAFSKCRSTDMQPAVAGRQDLCHPHTAWGWQGDDNGFFQQWTPRKGLQCIDKKDCAHTGTNTYVFCQYSLFLYKERKTTLSWFSAIHRLLSASTASLSCTNTTYDIMWCLAQRVNMSIQYTLVVVGLHHTSKNNH